MSFVFISLTISIVVALFTTWIFQDEGNNWRNFVVTFAFMWAVSGTTFYIVDNQLENQAKVEASMQGKNYPITKSGDCTAYKFRDSGRWHYFTQCAAKTTTESHHDESCGKNCTRDVVEFLSTVNK